MRWNNSRRKLVLWFCHMIFISSLQFEVRTVWAAPAAGPSAARWILLDKDILHDVRTGLDWTRSDNGHDINWLDAGRLCGARPGKWRLPTADQLASLYDESNAIGASCGGARCRIAGLFALTGSWFWSADPVGRDGSDGIELAWGVQMENGAHTKSVKGAGDGARALCVAVANGHKRAQFLEQRATVVLPIDQSHTAVIFSWSHRGFSHPIARLEQVSGTLLWNQADLTQSRVEVSLPLNGLRTGDDALDRRLRGAEFFDVSANPMVTFKSTEVVPTAGTNDLTLIGLLTVHGVTRPVTLLAKINQVKQPTGEPLWIGFDADGVLRRSDFGLGRYVPLVGDEIAVHITLEAHAE